MATIDDFKKLELSVVKVLSAERVEGSEKLLKLRVDIGTEERQILAGVGKSYEPEELIGKQLIAITNLETRVMMGEESQGMILATGDDIENIALIRPIKEVETGSKLR